MIKTIDTSVITSEMETAMESVFVKRFGRGARAFDPGITDEQIYAAWRSSKDNYMEHVRAALEAAQEVKVQPLLYTNEAELKYECPSTWSKAAKSDGDLPLYLHPPCPADGWLRAIDEALVMHDIGIANADDDYATAKDKLNNLLCINQDINDYFKKSDVVDRIKRLKIANPSDLVDLAHNGVISKVLALIEGA